MKVTTDGCLFGAWVAERVGRQESGDRSRESIGRQRLADGDAGVSSPGALTGSILDVGTGTGLLSLMIAQQSNAGITAIEIDKESFEQASDNIAVSPWTGRIHIFHNDARVFEFPGKYDIIISNPPFYENELKGENPKKNLARHNEGLLLPELLTIIKKNLQPDGKFFLLLPFKRNEEIRKLFFESELSILQLTFVRQTTKHDFFRIMLEGKLKKDMPAETLIDEISIKNDSSSGSADPYTQAFVNLLRDYYLHM